MRHVTGVRGWRRQGNLKVKRNGFYFYFFFLFPTFLLPDTHDTVFNKDSPPPPQKKKKEVTFPNYICSGWVLFFFSVENNGPLNLKPNKICKF